MVNLLYVDNYILILRVMYLLIIGKSQVNVGNKMRHGHYNNIIRAAIYLYF